MLEDESRGSKLERLRRVGDILMHGQKDNLCRYVGLLQLPNGFDAV